VSAEQQDKLRMEYERSKGSYESLVDEVMFVLRDSMKKNKMKYHSLTCREGKVKSFESFYDKVIRKDIRENPLNEVEDIAGVRVICLYRSDLCKIGEIIEENFEVVRTDTSRTRTENPFGYASDHYIVKISRHYKGARYDKIKDLKCEIQVRTILMDAWASVSHHLAYKQEADIPGELKADFNSLSGLFYIADTHFEFFRKGSEAARATLMKSARRDEFDIDQEINLDSLTAYAHWKFPERKGGDYSLLIKQLAQIGYKKLRRLDEKVEIARPLLDELEMKEFELKKWEPCWAVEGALRAALDMTDANFFSRWTRTLKRMDVVQKTTPTFYRYLLWMKDNRSRVCAR